MNFHNPSTGVTKTESFFKLSIPINPHKAIFLVAAHFVTAFSEGDEIRLNCGYKENGTDKSETLKYTPNKAWKKDDRVLFLFDRSQMRLESGQEMGSSSGNEYTNCDIVWCSSGHVPPGEPSSYSFDKVFTAAATWTVGARGQGADLHEGWAKLYLIGDGGSGGRGGQGCSNSSNPTTAGSGASGDTGAVVIASRYLRAGDTVTLSKTTTYWQLTVNSETMRAYHGNNGGNGTTTSAGRPTSTTILAEGGDQRYNGVKGKAGNKYGSITVCRGADAPNQPACVYTSVATPAKGGGQIGSGPGVPGEAGQGGRYSTTQPVILGTAGAGGGSAQPLEGGTGGSGGAGGAGGAGGLVVETYYHDVKIGGFIPAPPISGGMSESGKIDQNFT